MSTYHLDKLFAPHSVAVVGTSPRDGSLGRALLRNLRDGGFAGTIYLVNQEYDEIDGYRTFKTLRDLPEVPDVAVIATPASVAPAIVADAAAMQVPTAIIISTGLGNGPGSLAQACETAARGSGVRMIGPN